MSGKKFAVAINCMDGRVQLPVIVWMKDHFGVDFVDMITEPGPIKILAENTDVGALASIKKRILVSSEKHKAKLIAVVGHHDCAGNPLGKEAQLQQIEQSIAVVASWKIPGEIIGLWVNADWCIERIR